MSGEAERKRRIVILGDSIADGLGVAGRSYGELLTQSHGNAIEIYNLASTGRTIAETLQDFQHVRALQPDTVIIAHGSFESVFRPIGKAVRLIPRRWRTKGWLDPRPYFSRRPLKGTYQRIESAIRWRYKVMLVKYVAGASYATAEEFGTALDALIKEIAEQTRANIVILTLAGIDERYYPGSPGAALQMNSRMVEAAQRPYAQRCKVCDVSQLLLKWDDFFADHFHPNASGHGKIASAIARELNLEQ